ncbi:unnamed protein product [Blepharisma stoltei]|uniref:Uncharacterized protein n=1 Tax=Blepharisma stoltei TaxID=1481888 RepID=A0AAU9JDQ7_9CILI|nr:unnamed protein product [Blepharisma stoltei]
MIFKYSAITNDKICEYPGNKDSNLLNYGIGGALACFFLSFFLIFIAFFGELFTADIRHHSCSKNLTARSHSSVDLKLLALRTLFSISHILFGNGNIIKYQITFLVVYLWIYFESLTKLTYYSEIENSIKSCKIFTVTLTLFSVLLAAAMDNAGVAFMLIFFMQPVWILINFWIVNTRFKYLKKKSVSFESQYDFERTIRALLCNKTLENKREVLDHFAACYTNKRMLKDKLLVIWEVNFCTFSMKDEILARIKLTKIKSAIGTIEGIIQEWRAVENINERDTSSLEINYLEYLADFDKIKKQDEEICCTLIDLWSEFSARNPQFKKIYHLVIRSSYLLSSLKKVYTKLVVKHKHLELYDLYISFLESILGETDQARIINRLKNGISHQLNFAKAYDAKLGTYDESNGIILISANEKSFGIITYMNNSASQLLKGSITDLIGTHLHYYIPSPYSYQHDDYMKEYYKNYTNDQTPHKGWFFLQNTLGYLVECMFLIKLTAYYNNAYFLVSLTPRNTSRQFAIISPEGLIYNYTDLFPYYLGTGLSNVRNYSITELLPILDLTENKLFKPLIIQHKGRKLAIIHTTKQLRLATIHMIIIVYNDNEIKQWKAGEDKDQIEYFKKTEINTSSEEKSYLDTSVLSQETGAKVKFQKLDSFRSLEESQIQSEEDKDVEMNRLLKRVSTKSEKDDENDDKSENQHSSLSNSSTSIVSKYVGKIFRNLKIFERILLFCMLAVIGTNIAILGYIYQDTVNTSSLDVFSHFGTLMFHLVNSAELARSIDSEKKSNIYNLTRDLATFKSTITKLKDLRSYILSDYDDWSYCKSSEIVVDNVVPVWIFEPSTHISKFNFYDEINLFIKHGDSLIDLISNNRTYTMEDVKFFGLNSLGFTYKVTQNAMNDLVDCEVNRVKHIGKYINSLIFTGLGLLLLFIGILAGYAIYMNRYYDEFWNFIKQISLICWADLKAIYIDRLLKIHGIDYKTDQTPVVYSKRLKTTKKIQSRIYIKYLWRLSIFLVIAACYYFILQFYLYNKCENYLIDRPKLILNLITKRTLLSRMSVFARDIASTSNLRWFPNSYALPQSKNAFCSTSRKFKIENSKLRNSNFLSLMTQNMKTRLFEEWDSTNDYYLHHGSYIASNLIYLEARFLSNTPSGLENVPYFSNYIGNESALQVALDSDYDIIDKNSKEIIKDQLKLLIFVTIAFSLALIFLFLFLYLPFIYKEKNSLNKLKALISIVPSTNIDLRNENLLK